MRRFSLLGGATGARLDIRVVFAGRGRLVECTIAWFNLYHRLNEDYELLPEVREFTIPFPLSNWQFFPHPQPLSQRARGVEIF